MKKVLYVVLLFLLASCTKTPSEQIINYIKKNKDNDFKSEIIDFSRIFEFKWETIYIFSPLTYPEDIEKEIGFKYDGNIVKDNNYLFLFVENNHIVKKFTYSELKIGFDDNNNMGVYKIDFKDAKYKVKPLGNNNYWFYKIK